MVDLDDIDQGLDIMKKQINLGLSQKASMYNIPVFAKHWQASCQIKDKLTVTSLFQNNQCLSFFAKENLNYSLICS